MNSELIAYAIPSQQCFVDAGETLCDLSLPLPDSFSSGAESFSESPPSSSSSSGKYGALGDGALSRIVGVSSGDGAISSRMRLISQDSSNSSSTNYPSVELEPASPHRRPSFPTAPSPSDAANNPGGRRHHRTMTPHDLISAAYPPPASLSSTLSSTPHSTTPHSTPPHSLPLERRASDAEANEDADADDGYDEGIEEEEDFGRNHFVLDSPYVRSDQEFHRVNIFNDLPDLLKDNHDQCMERIVPKVLEVLNTSTSPRAHQAASTAFLKILRSQLVSPTVFITVFLQTILKGVESVDADVEAIWLETLLRATDSLPDNVIVEEILSLAVTKGHSPHLSSRLASSRLLGKIASKFDAFLLQRDVLPVVQSLCQDVDHQVRASMCRQLGAVARGLDVESTKSSILPELVELTKDAEKSVRIAGIEVVGDILDLFDEETSRQILIPLVMKFLESSLEVEDSCLPLVVKQIGKLTIGLEKHLTLKNKIWFLNLFCRFCHLGVRSTLRHRRRNSDLQPSPSDEFLPLRFVPFQSSSYSSMQANPKTNSAPTTSPPSSSAHTPPSNEASKSQSSPAIDGALPSTTPASPQAPPPPPPPPHSPRPKEELSPDGILSPGSNLDSPGSSSTSSSTPGSGPSSPGCNSINSDFKLRRKLETLSSMEREEMMIRCRINAAYNFPAMALLYAGIGSASSVASAPASATASASAPAPASATPSASASASASSSSSSSDHSLLIGSQLLTSLSTLCKDPRPEVRRRVAAGFHEIAACLKDVDDSELDNHNNHRQRRLSASASSPSARSGATFFAETTMTTTSSSSAPKPSSLFDSLAYLLFDESLSVLRGFVKHLDLSLRVLADKYLLRADGSYFRDDDDEEDEDEEEEEEGQRNNGVEVQIRTHLRQMLFAGLVQSEETVYHSYDWRLQADVFEKWAEFMPIWFSSDQIFFNVVPFLFDKIRDSRPMPVRHAASICLLRLLRENRRLEHRNEIRDQIIREFCKGRSSTDRTMFISILRQLLPLFSRDYIKANFFGPFLLLATDQIIDVRIKFIQLLPQIRALITLPNDEALLIALESAVDSLLSSSSSSSIRDALYRVHDQGRFDSRMDDNVDDICAEDADDDRDSSNLRHERKLIEEEKNRFAETKLKNDFNESEFFYHVQVTPISSPSLPAVAVGRAAAEAARDEECSDFDEPDSYSVPDPTASDCTSTDNAHSYSAASDFPSADSAHTSSASEAHAFSDCVTTVTASSGSLTITSASDAVASSASASVTGESNESASASAAREPALISVLNDTPSPAVDVATFPSSSSTRVIDAPLPCDARVIDAPLPCDARVIDAPLSCDARVIDAPLSCDARVIDAPLSCDARVIDAPLSCDSLDSETSYPKKTHLEDSQSLSELSNNSSHTSTGPTYAFSCSSSTPTTEQIPSKSSSLPKSKSASLIKPISRLPLARRSSPPPDLTSAAKNSKISKLPGMRASPPPPGSMQRKRHPQELPLQSQQLQLQQQHQRRVSTPVGDPRYQRAVASSSSLPPPSPLTRRCTSPPPPRAAAAARKIGMAAPVTRAPSPFPVRKAIVPAADEEESFAPSDEKEKMRGYESGDDPGAQRSASSSSSSSSSSSFPSPRISTSSARGSDSGDDEALTSSSKPTKSVKKLKSPTKKTSSPINNPSSPLTVKPPLKPKASPEKSVATSSVATKTAKVATYSAAKPKVAAKTSTSTAPTTTAKPPVGPSSKSIESPKPEAKKPSSFAKPISRGLAPPSSLLTKKAAPASSPASSPASPSSPSPSSASSSPSSSPRASKVSSSSSSSSKSLPASPTNSISTLPRSASSKVSKPPKGATGSTKASSPSAITPETPSKTLTSASKYLPSTPSSTSSSSTKSFTSASSPSSSTTPTTPSKLPSTKSILQSGLRPPSPRPKVRKEEKPILESPTKKETSAAPVSKSSSPFSSSFPKKSAIEKPKSGVSRALPKSKPPPSSKSSSSSSSTSSSSSLSKVASPAQGKAAATIGSEEEARLLDSSESPQSVSLKAPSALTTSNLKIKSAILRGSGLPRLKANSITLKASSSEPILAATKETKTSSTESLDKIKVPSSSSSSSSSSLHRRKSNLTKEKSSSGGSLSIPPPREGGFGFKKSAAI